MDHKDALEKLCRVCGRMVVTKSVKVKHLCKDYADKLTVVFGVSTQSDDENIHPRYFCHACKIVLMKASSTVVSYQHRTVVFMGWCSHVEGSCTVCQHFLSFKQGGRPRKVKRTPGRPPSVSPRYCIDHIHSVAPPPLPEPITVCNHHQQLSLSELVCPICCDIIRSPVELVTCESVVCAECICLWLQHKNELVCPCCYSNHLQNYTTTIRRATSLTLHFLGTLCVICDCCNEHVRLKSYSDHINNNCIPHTLEVSPDTSIVDILRQPMTSPLTPVEQKLQTSLARRSLSTINTEDSILQMKTGGRVSSKC